MKYLSVCSGIEAATVAWHPLGWTPVAFAEIDPFPCAVLNHRYPDIPNLGNLSNFNAWPAFEIDLLCGGTPCQSFSVAGLRAGFTDPRGNLALTFLGVAERYRPAWVVWENVPGVLSSNGGRDFGAFLGALGQLGYGWAYRVLNAQYFGVPQRRRRVFVVGYLGDWRTAAKVLFEPYCLSGNSPPGRSAGEDVAGALEARVGAGGFPGTDGACGGHLVPAISRTLNAGGMGRQDSETETLVVAPVLSRPYADNASRESGLIAATLTKQYASHHGRTAGNNGGVATGQLQPEACGVRRLTPRECERLQGFPDDYTLVPHRGKPAADGPRYKALGNSMAVPVMRWIGERIQMHSK